ncbi:branched-chain amino acid ABC transporter permease [bacterium]|nr:branched-chain amino acid ABC transporter permease [bacterium]
MQKKIINWLKEFFSPKGIMSTSFKNSPPLRYVLFGLSLCIAPLLIKYEIMEYSTLSVIATILIYAIVALGLNLLLGFSGLISLGTAGFVGFGAYGIVYFSNEFELTFFAATIITLIIAGLIGALIGLFSLKVEGIYLAIATLFIGEIFLQIFRQVTWFTGGFSGQRFHYPQFNFIFKIYEMDRNITYIFLVVMLVLTMIIIYNIVNSRTGRALMAMSRSEHAAQAMGISLLKYRLVAFISATLFATLAGVLYVSFFRYVEPTAWNLNLSLLIIAMVVVGGFKSIFGTFIGAFIIYGVPNLWLKEFFQSVSGLSYIFSGILIIVVIMFYPYGAVYIWYDMKKLYYKLKLRLKKKVISDE